MTKWQPMVQPPPQPLPRKTSQNPDFAWSPGTTNVITEDPPGPSREANPIPNCEDVISGTGPGTPKPPPRHPVTPGPGTAGPGTADPGTAELQLGIAMANLGTTKLHLSIP